MPLRAPSRNAKKELIDTTIRDFSGGWNVIDNELTLDPKYAPVLDNMYRAQDGSLKVRQGTRLLGRTDAPDDATLYLFGDYSATITTSAGSPNVVITLGASAPVTYNIGQRMTIADVVTTYDTTITPATLNGSRRVITANHTTGAYTVIADANATAGSGPTALDSSATFDRTDTISSSPIIGMTYFDTYLVTVHQDGTISRTDGTGVTEIIWDVDIDLMVGGAGAWSTGLTFASFTIFGGPASGGTGLSSVPKLLVCNGVDRSVIIDFQVDEQSVVFTLYNDTNQIAVPNALHDSPTGARYVAAMPEFCVMAGIPGYESVLAISDQDTPYVWPDIATGSAAAAGLATVLDFARIINVTDPTIRGICRFRDDLVVGFDNALALVSFGVSDDGTEPTHAVTEVINGQGAISHLSMKSIGDDIYMCDIVGVPSLKQALYTGGVRTERVSQLIDPEIQSLVTDLTVGQGEDFIYSVWNPLESQYMLFVPNDIAGGVPSGFDVYVYTLITSLKVRAWSRYTGWGFRTGCVSPLGRVFLAEDTEIYVLGTQNDVISVDYLNGTTYGVTGTPIDFIWELPWADFDKRINIKKSEYIALETAGTAAFTVRMYIDGIENSAIDASDAPALETDFVGGGGPGYGVEAQVYGGGRSTYQEYLWKWPAKFKIAKLKFSGAADAPLNFVSISLLYKDGGFRR